MSEANFPASSTGAAGQPAAGKDMQAAASRSRALAASIGAVVSIMMRSPEYRNAPLSEIERLIGPPIGFDQVAIVEARNSKTGIVAPVAAVLWAQVSQEVDQRLSDVGNAKPRLEPAEWRSGPIPWIITAVGAKGAVAKLLEQLVKARFAETPPKIRVREKDGPARVGYVRINASGTVDEDGVASLS